VTISYTIVVTSVTKIPENIFEVAQMAVRPGKTTFLIAAVNNIGSLDTVCKNVYIYLLRVY